MPTITPAEIAILVAAVLLLYAAPFLLTMLEDSRRRKAERWAGPATASVPFSPVADTAPVADESLVDAVTNQASEAAAGEGPAAVEVPPAPENPVTGTAASVTAVSHALEAPAFEVAPAAADETVSLPAAVTYTGYNPPTATPFHGNDGERFRLEDLHRARLADWPPETVRSNPARHQLWTEAERLAAAHDAVISSSVLDAPCAVRSACLGGIERGPSRTCLHFLLFPDLWPASPEQAVARAVFEIDSASGEIRHSVDVLPPSQP